MIDPTAVSTIRVGELSPEPFSLTDNIPHEVGTELKRGSIEDLATFISAFIGSTDGVGFRAISVTDGQTLPTTTQQEFILVGKGTYYNVVGGSTIICTEELNAIVSNGSYWFIGVEIPVNVELAGITQFIRDGFISTTPSEDAVYDALALKANVADSEDVTNKVSTISTYSTTLYPNEKATHDALDLKLNISDLPTNLTLYPTNVASDVSGYIKMVTDIHAPDYNTVAVDVSTPAITGTGQLVSQRIADAGVLIGQPGVFNVTTFGNIRRLSGSGTATFYFEVYHRDALGVETLICTSSISNAVVNGTYQEFTASGIWDDGEFSATDRIVIKSYANRIVGGSDPVYQFQFGGTTPVRTLLPVPFSVVDAGYELIANKQNDLTIDGTGTKYPTVDAVNSEVVKLSTTQTISGLKDFTKRVMVNRTINDLNYHAFDDITEIHTTAPTGGSGYASYDVYINNTSIFDVNHMHSYQSRMRNNSTAILERTAGFSYQFENNGTIIDQIGITIASPTGTGTITNKKAISIGDYSGGYAIYSAGGDNFFGGKTTTAKIVPTNLSQYKLPLYSGTTDGLINSDIQFYLGRMNINKTWVSGNNVIDVRGISGAGEAVIKTETFENNSYYVELYSKFDNNNKAGLRNATGNIIKQNNTGDITIGAGSFVVKSTGALETTALTLKTTPTTSAGTYDILTRNTSTGLVEKVLSNTISTVDSPAFTGIPTAPTATAGTNTTQIATTAFAQGIRPYKVYTAILTQTGTSAPTAIILENTIGSIVWSRTVAGGYFATLSGAFTTDKTSVLITNGSANATYIHGASVSNSNVNVITADDGQIDRATIEIRVYN